MEFSEFSKYTSTIEEKFTLQIEFVVYIFEPLELLTTFLQEISWILSLYLILLTAKMQI